MWQGLNGLLETTWKLSNKTERALGIAFLFFAFLSIWFSAIDEKIFTEHRIAWLIILLVTYLAAVIPPVTKMTRFQHKYVLYVVLWGLVSLTFVLVIFYLAYFALANTELEQRRWERVLNLPPVIVAAVAAAIGWYAAQQYSLKNNRTNNSFSLVMEMRCNAEFMKCTHAIAVSLPPSVSLTAEHAIYFPSQARNRFEYLKAKGLANKLNETEIAEFGRYDEQMLLGIEAAKYFLNFYEFMAYGIYVGDLDEDLLYETVSPAVVSLHRRVEAFRDYLTGPKGDKLALEQLHRLVEGYEKDEQGRRTQVLGWAQRLDIERASGPR